MMIRTAGGPGPVSPLDFHERKRPLPRSVWAAIGIAAAAHVAVGVTLYHQKFEMQLVAPPAETPPPDGFWLELPKPPPPKPTTVTEAPQPPNLPLNRTPLPSQPTETIAAVPGDAPVDSSTATLSHPVPTPVPDATPTPEPPKPTPAPSVIRNPSWMSQPTGDQLMRAYPQRAVTAGIDGRAALNCAVLADGRVNDCRVTSETPGGYGFGRAAQGLSRHFRVNPRTIDGAAVDTRVDIGIRFTLPQD